MPVSLRSGSSKETGIRQMTINQRASLKSKIRLAPYNPDWPMQYAELAGRIRAALGKKALLLEHVGSTSVPGLCAKPVIDIVLAVADSADEPSYIPPLEACGFALRFREPDWYQHRLLKSNDIQANLHVFSEGCEETDRMLSFRDRLRWHEDERILYEKSKRELAAQTWEYTQNYADAKTPVIRAILARALES